MPELRLVVLALQDRLAYGPTFESALGGLFGSASASPAASGAAAGSGLGPAAAAARPAQSSTSEQAGDVNVLIAAAARDLAEYQRLTAEGKLGEAGQRLEALKLKLDQLAKLKR